MKLLWDIINILCYQLTQSTSLSIPSFKDYIKVMVKCIPNSVKHIIIPRISLLVVTYITIHNMCCSLVGFYLSWNHSIKTKNKNKNKTKKQTKKHNSIIADLPQLFSLIQFLMIHLHNRICILFHRKWYDSTCLTSDKVSERESNDMGKEVKSHFAFLKQVLWG